MRLKASRQSKNRSLVNRFAAALMMTTLAQTSFANVVGADTQNFNPTPNGLDFVTVQSSETLEPGIMNFGFFLNYAVNTLPIYVDKITQTRSQSKDSLTSSDFNIGLGLTKNWDIGFSVPMVLNQSINVDVFKGGFEKTGITEYRLYTKYRLSGDDRGGFALVGSANLPQTENNPFIGDKANPIYNIEAAMDSSSGPWAYGLNLGYRIRSPGQQLFSTKVQQLVPIEPLKDQYLASVGLSYYSTSWDTRWISEIFASAPAKSSTTQTNSDLTTAELILGLKKDLNQSVAWHAGLGTELMQGSSTPDWRIYTGLNYAIGPLWKKPASAPIEKHEVTQPAASAATELPPVVIAEERANFDDAVVAKQELYLTRIPFEQDSDIVTPEWYPYLDSLVSHLNKDPGFIKVTIHGNTDSVGSDEYNQNLSERRAERVRQILVKKYSIDGTKLRTVGHGEFNPAGDNGTFQGRALNRRVEFDIQR